LTWLNSCNRKEPRSKPFSRSEKEKKKRDREENVRKVSEKYTQTARSGTQREITFEGKWERSFLVLSV
jgi:hypothetical protein